MEVEQESKAKKYIKLNVGGEIILLDEHLLPYFKSVALMIADNGGLEGIDEIPLAGPGITPELVKMAITFYTLYDKLQSLELRNTIDTMRRIITGKVVIEEESQSFIAEYLFLSKDEYQLAALAQVADFLLASELVVFALDELYSKISVLSAEELQRRKNRVIKTEDIVSSGKGKSLLPRLQYRREEQIRAVLSSMLPYTLVRGIDPRIGQYPALLVVNDDMALIRDEDTLLFFPFYESLSLATLAGPLSLIKGEEALQTQRINEVSVGQIFFTTLDENGKLAVYGELTKLKGNPKDLKETFGFLQFGANGELIPEKPLKDELCIAVWSGYNTIIVLTNTTVYAHGSWLSATANPSKMRNNQTNQMSRVDEITSSELLDVSCGPSHTFFLTRKGLYGCGINNEGVLGIGTTKTFVFTPTLIDVDGQEIVKVWAGSNHSLALSKKGVLYGCGLVSLSFNTTPTMPYLSIIPRWTKIPLPMDMPKIDIIIGSSYYTIVVAGNMIYKYDAETDSLVADPFNQGIIKDLMIIDLDILVYTSTGIYLIARYSNPPDIIEALGGTDSVTSPYKLRIEVVPDEQENQADQTNKKPGLGCHVCRATALYANASKTGFFCSLYCLHKQEIK